MEKYTGLEVAVIGLSGKFPKADNIKQYWDNLVNGRDCVSDFTEEEIIEEGEDIVLVKDPMYVKSNACLENKQFFDAAFFGYRSHEAELMDPQVRLFHECCWEALEDSGYSTEHTNRKIALYASGSSDPDWEIYAMLQNEEGLVDDFSASQLRDVSYLASRVAYKLNLRGPAVFVHTACSSSLAAIHQAYNSLLLGECEMAIAGGVSVNNYSKRGYLYQQGMIFSKDGRCRPFDVNASGTIAGEGVGVVVLKRLQDAIKDNDHIYAVIKGSAINNDGNDKAGFTAPGVKGQVDVIKKAHKMAAVAISGIGYVEAHGTATQLGDAIEIEALNQAFEGSKPLTCAIGSVKSNIGHLDAAAGVAGFIKTVLALKYKKLLPSLHYTNPNPSIPFEKGPFYVNNTTQDWMSSGSTIKAGISSFGIGGTNVHMVLEESITTPRSTAGRKSQLLTFSAKTPAVLERNISCFTTYLKHNEEIALADVSYTLNLGRSTFPYRISIASDTREDAIRKMSEERFLQAVAISGNRGLRNIIFMFSGQGTQYPGMFKDIYDSEVIFREKVDECFLLSQQYTARNLRAALLSMYADGTELADIDDTTYTQPLLFIVEYAYAHMLMQWGVVPDMMIGHSIGEYVAACLSGVLSLEDALKLVIRRGELMGKVKKGKMLSIAIDEEGARNLLAGYEGIEIAVINSQEGIVVAGNEGAIEAFCGTLSVAGIKNKVIPTSHAFHSYMMEDMLPEFEQTANTIKINPPNIPYVSNLHGGFVTFDELNKGTYWSKHVRNTVRFSKGIDLLIKQGPAIFIEIGPGKALCNHVNLNPLLSDEYTVVNMIRASQESINDQYYLVEKMGTLWEAGINIKWSEYYGKESRARLSLPTYSFEKVPYSTVVNIDSLLQKRYGKSRREPGTGDVNAFASTWKKTVIPKIVKEESLKILLFKGNEHFSDSLAAYLRDLGHNIIAVVGGQTFKVIHEGLLEVNYNHLTLLWDYLGSNGFSPDHIVYNTALYEQFSSPDYTSALSGLEDGYLNLCRLAQSIATMKSVHDISITVYNNYVAKVFDQDDVNALKSAILGCVKVMPLELMNVTCKLVDIPYPFTNEQARKYLPGLAGELFYEKTVPLVAYRAGQRWKHGFDKLEASKQTTSAVKIIRGGTYIVTGGAGGIGFSIAKDLARKGGANVIIIHRSDLSAEMLEELTVIRAEGQKVDLYQMDVSKESDVAHFANEISEKYGRINGLIWSAGEVDRGGIIQNRTTDDLIRYTDSKIKGVLLFQRFIDFASFDFIALFSSIGNVFYQSKFGQVAYNAANEFMEAHVASLREQFGIHAFAINWCDWLDVGMTVKTMQQQDTDIRQINAQITDGIYPSEGVNMFHRCLEGIGLSTTIYRGDLNEAIREHQHEFESFRDEMNGAPEENKEVHKIRTTEEKVMDVFREFFGRSYINDEDNFFELGGDSLEGMTLIARINKKIGVRLAIGDLYKHPDVKSLVRYLASQEDKQGGSEIPKAPKKEYYQLSSSQRRMYFLQQLNPNSTAYNGVQILMLDGLPDKNKLKDSINKVIQRHEILRTKFELVNETMVQKVEEVVNFLLEEYESDGTDIDILIQRFVRSFNLNQAPVFRAGLIRIDQLSHLLLFDLHHIVTDGVSNNILASDFMDLYNGKELMPLRLQYRDFAEWQQSEPEQQRIYAQKEFWMNMFSELPAPLDLPLDFSRPLSKGTEGAKLVDELSDKHSLALKKLAEKEGVSMFMLLLSIYHVLLGKLSGQSDIVVGVSTAGRLNADLEGVMGMFVNTLPFRNRSEEDQPFSSFLQDVKNNTLSCFDNQEYQYEDIVESLGISRDMSRNPLFDVMFSYENFERVEMELEGLRLKPYNEEHEISKFDLTLIAGEDSGIISIQLEYSTALFMRESIEQICLYFKRIVGAIIENSNVCLRDISIMDQEECNRLLIDFNNTDNVHSQDRTIIDLFEEQVYRTPSETALQFGKEMISYKDLHVISDQLAVYLQAEFNLGGGDLVGVIAERNIDLVIVLLGILKAGAAYIPIDPAYPEARTSMILRDAGVKLVLDDQRISIVRQAAASYSGDKLYLRPVGTDLAYVIYTSGSTGQPKGVMIAHHSLANYLRWARNHYIHSNTETVFSLHSSISFDLTITSLFLPLISGGRLKIFGGGNNPGVIGTVIADTEVNVVKLTPSHLKLIRDLPVSARPMKFIIGGELLERTVAEDIYQQYGGQASLYNEYGPTESTVGCMLYLYNPLEGGYAVPIGKPIWNTRLYVLDEELRPVALGVRGELYIGGAGLAVGYANNPLLTSQRFIDSPFVKGDRLYRTGDQVRMLSWDKMVYLGRLDDQVKLRGYRIELGEISGLLNSYEGISDSVAVVMGTSEDQYLCGYYVSSATIDHASLRSYLQEQLPVYMVPDHLQRIDHIPLTQNGKVDYKALPDIEITAGDGYIAPSGEIEEQLVEIWADVLQLEKEDISVTRSFFELGGNSLEIVALTHKINITFGRSIGIADMFGLTTILAIKEFLLKGDTERLDSIRENIAYAIDDAEEDLKMLEDI
ncbi:hybrid non-ribosomal peptide synthetase/type I polyketide synthase [Chitinophaga pendula]|uniref:hybrid non-ribosomal peptide synthetase/type I polyketide synthase n=1 Tax=Chitinophaga TaxID=79328 RepID=UPI000BAF6349|nr:MULTISPECIES: hybrid non-ribosomal peptide synthetase/type I polyketide synthase [Chitinophaga]ASZ13663.1 hypothetical protein CK934_23265 [Chitinophaga sp. MD30]UCJ08712.1 hybrid non-ribosomal peptide synthetase/type I polyketide synthase [Chitinophaga pendula]